MAHLIATLSLAKNSSEGKTSSSGGGPRRHNGWVTISSAGKASVGIAALGGWCRRQRVATEKQAASRDRWSGQAARTGVTVMQTADLRYGHDLPSRRWLHPSGRR